MEKSMQAQMGDIVPNNQLQAPAKQGACDLSAPVKTAEELEAEKLGVSVGRFRAMKAYAAQLVRSDPRMKTSTVRKKVAKKYNIKLT